MRHKVKVIPKEEILANRSDAYEFIDFDKQETLRDKLESLVVQWHQRQEHYVDVAYRHVDDAHNNRKFTYKAMATRDCWKELLTLLNSHKDEQ